MRPKTSGYVIYRGPSLLNGAPIVAIANVSKSSQANTKTGAMVQTYILADNGTKPTANLHNGADVAICGDCKHRPASGGACYVVVAQGPTVIYKQYLLGNYPEIPAELAGEIFAGKMVRLGTYGDPAAVPASVWRALVSQSSGRTGYTHQWRNAALGGAQLEALRALVMASADSPSERDSARASGWRTFTVRLDTEALGARESMCPASAEAGKKITCIDCGLCNGAESGRKGSIAIYAHGYRTKAFAVIRSALPIQSTI
jgi:hypothetical protein